MNTRFTLKIVDPSVRETLFHIMRVIKPVGGQVLIVGGSIRDSLLGLTPKDFDLEVYGVSPTQLLEILSNHFSLDLVGEAFGVIKLKGMPIDIALPRRESKRGLGHKGFDIHSDPSMTIQEAASRRDFTINAMAWNPDTQELLDPFNGCDDLENKILRHTTEKFQEDPLRVLRGIQFAGRYSLVGAPDTLRMSHELLSEYDTLPIERIWGEWYKWAAKSVLPSAGLAFLRDAGWIQKYPELDALIGCQQDPEFHPEGDVWTHTLLVTDEAAFIAERERLSEDDRTTLVLSALCHDLGKPGTTEIIDNRIRSRGHCDTVEIFHTFLTRLGTPSRIIERVIALCRYHLTHIDFQDSLRHVRRVSVALAAAGETIDMLSRLVEADHSGRPPLPKGLPANMKHMMDAAANLNLQHSSPSPILLGRHLLALGFSPGPDMGDILRLVFDAQLNGDIHNLDEAQKWVKEHCT